MLTPVTSTKCLPIEFGECFLADPDLGSYDRAAMASDEPRKDERARAVFGATAVYEQEQKARELERGTLRGTRRDATG